MPLLEAEAELLAALTAATPDAQQLPTRRGPVLRPLAVEVHRTTPGISRLGSVDEVVHRLDCVIIHEAGYGDDVEDDAFNAVYDAFTAFLVSIKETQPGGLLIWWGEGIETNIAVDGPRIEAHALIPLAERYPRAG